MGQDDRRPASDAETQLPGVRDTGTIRIPGEEFVTGLLVGANCDVVISAGHAAIHWRTIEHRGWVAGERRGDGKLEFSLDPAAAKWHQATLITTGFDRPGNIDQEHNDWALFRLAERASTNCRQLHYENYKVTCRGATFMPGYHFDKRNTRLVDTSCSPKYALKRRLIAHDCDTKDGSSGAPLFCREGAKTYLMGINVSGLTERSYIDPGIYGENGLSFRYHRHENFAVGVHGKFFDAINSALAASKNRHREHTATRK